MVGRGEAVQIVLVGWHRHQKVREQIAMIVELILAPLGRGDK